MDSVTIINNWNIILIMVTVIKIVLSIMIILIIEEQWLLVYNDDNKTNDGKSRLQFGWRNESISMLPEVING